jgi:hypothetical protein
VCPRRAIVSRAGWAGRGLGQRQAQVLLCHQALTMPADGREGMHWQEVAVVHAMQTYHACVHSKGTGRLSKVLPGRKGAVPGDTGW